VSVAATLAKLPIDRGRQTGSPATEWSALLEATNFASELNPETFAELDWESFFAAAEYHGVAAIVAQRLLDSPIKSRLVPGVERRLRHVYQTILMRSFPLAQEIHSITRDFKKAGLHIIPYKGPALAERYWGSYVLRDCVDIDFLVRPQDVQPANSLLEQLGYEPVARIRPHLLPAFIENASEQQFRHRETGLLLELQWAPSPQVFALRFNLRSLWSNTRETQFSGENVLSPSAEDLLLLLCIHGWKHNWSRLIWVGDIVQLLASEAIDWDQLVVRAKKEGSFGVLSLGLQMARVLFSIPLPRAISIREDIANLSEALIARMKSTQSCSYLEWHRFMLDARDSHRDRIQHMSSFILTPGLGEYAACDLPSWARSGYRLIRLARVLRLLPGKAIE
jgi:hypothetical protein